MRLSVLALLSSAFLVPLAHADTVSNDLVTVSGDGYTFSFSLPSTFDTQAPGTYVDFSDVPVSYGSATYPAQVELDEDGLFHGLILSDSNNYLEFDGMTPFYTVNADGTMGMLSTGVVNATAFINCEVAQLRKAHQPGLASMPLLAMLQMPNFGSACDEAATVDIEPTGTPVSATPEPSSVLLLGTGALGLLGIGTRRLWS